ncbi:MAG: hypothetical protein ACTHMW_00040 [Actinomycetes bacterium]
MAQTLPRSPLRIASVALVTVGLVLGCFGAVLGLAHRAEGTDAATLVVLLGAAACTAAGCVLMELLDQRVTRAAGLPATAPSWAWSLGTLALLEIGGGVAAAPACWVLGIALLAVTIALAAVRLRAGATTRRSTISMLESVGVDGPADGQRLSLERQHVARGSQRVYLRSEGVLVLDTVVPTATDADALAAAANLPER